MVLHVPSIDVCNGNPIHFFQECAVEMFGNRNVETAHCVSLVLFLFSFHAVLDL